jgi:hypothetical protein
VLEIDKSRHAADDARVELELFVAQLDDGGTSLVVGPPLSALPPGPDWRENLTLNQATLVEVLADIFPVVGATKAELKAETLKRPRRKLDGSSECACGRWPVRAGHRKPAVRHLRDQQHR